MTRPIRNAPAEYNQNVDRIDKRLDEIEHLHTLSGDEYVEEAQRLGLVVTERGIYADPNHPAREYLTADQNLELITRLFRRHGHEFQLDPDVEPDPSVP